MTRALIDTNLLVLMLVGASHPDWIGNRKPVGNFAPTDFDYLVNSLEGVGGFLTTPHILTETSNLLGIPKRSSATSALVSMFVKFVEKSVEIPVSSREIVSVSAFLRFGLTDTGIMMMRAERAKILTVDFALFGKLSELGMNVENIRHQTKL